MKKNIYEVVLERIVSTFFNMHNPPFASTILLKQFTLIHQLIPNSYILRLHFGSYITQLTVSYWLLNVGVPRVPCIIFYSDSSLKFSKWRARYIQSTDVCNFGSTVFQANLRNSISNLNFSLIHLDFLGTFEKQKVLTTLDQCLCIS